MKTAIIGGGVSGLSLAYFLHSKNLDFVLFERENQLGGNAHTRSIVHNNQEKYVDMAVNDFNPNTYQRLNKLMAQTNAATGQVKANTTFFSSSHFLFKESELMGTTLATDIQRFREEAMEVLQGDTYKWYSVEQYFEEKGYSPAFLSLYLFPRLQGLFFFPPQGLNVLPVHFVMHFYALQGGFQYKAAPLSTRFNFKGGAGKWIENLAKSIPVNKIIKATSPKIEKTASGFRVATKSSQFLVDKLVFACHADDLCNNYGHMLAGSQHNALSKVKYAKMLSVAHCDTSYLPVEQAELSAYNCLVKDPQDVQNNNYTITYCCNEHQNLSNGGHNIAGKEDCFFVTVNPVRKIADRFILKDKNGAPLVKEFRRNICDFDLLHAQQALRSQQGSHGIFFTGGYTNGIGLHENCLKQSAELAEMIQLGNKTGMNMASVG